MKTIKQYLNYASESLKNAGNEAPVLEAGVMLCHVLKCDRAYLYTHDDRVLQKAEYDQLELILGKRLQNVPLQYLLGETEFMSLTFRVSPAVLIPRQDTELLVEKCMELVGSLSGQSSEALRVLDLCTGSGCIGVSVAHYCPAVTVVASDISLAALEVAVMNSEAVGVKNRMEFCRGDLFDAIGQEERFDIIASNPPYIESSTVQELKVQVKDHEPLMALDGGLDGLSFYRRIASAAPGFLREKGYLLLEIGYSQGQSVSKLLEESFDGVTVIKDLGGNDRVVSGRLKTRRSDV